MRWAWALLGSIAAAWLLAVAPALAAADEATPDPIAWRQSAFSIPFKVAPAASADQQPTEVRLYVSTNQGAKWELAQTVPPKATSFTYRAPSDGEYWFLIRSVDKSGKVDPELGAKPELRVIVDTIAPRLELFATRGEAGEVRVNWKAVDPLLNADSLKIEYQTNDGKWHPVAIDRPVGNGNRSTTSGTMTWWPTDTPATVAIRAEVNDRAGNVTVSHAKAEAVAKTDSPAKGDSPAKNDLSPAGGVPATGPARGQQNDRTAANGWSTTNGSNTTQNPFVSATPSSKPSASQWPADRVAADPFGRAPIDTAQLPDRPLESTVNPPIRNQFTGAESSPANQGNNSAASQSGSPWGNNNSSTGNAAAGISTAAGNSASGMSSAGNGMAGNGPKINSPYSAILPPGERPRMVSSRTFDLEYEVDGIGPYGIAKVELWGTQDGGHTWKSYGVDDDNRSPIRATVEGEGLYGFRIAVQSGNGLGGQPPRDGDSPQMWIAVDLTKPVVRLTGIQAGSAEHAGELMIRWEASDAALAARPIMLMFSDKATGPWSIIAAGLENTGSYSWRPDSRAPDRIYVRIEARDDAGNKATFDTTEPTTLEHMRPEGRIREVHPAGQSSASAGPISVQGWVDGGIMGR